MLPTYANKWFYREGGTCPPTTSSDSHNAMMLSLKIPALWSLLMQFLTAQRKNNFQTTLCCRGVDLFFFFFVHAEKFLDCWSSVLWCWVKNQCKCVTKWSCYQCDMILFAALPSKAGNARVSDRNLVGYDRIMLFLYYTSNFYSL